MLAFVLFTSQIYFKHTYLIVLLLLYSFPSWYCNFLWQLIIIVVAIVVVVIIIIIVVFFCLVISNSFSTYLVSNNNWAKTSRIFSILFFLLFLRFFSNVVAFIFWYCKQFLLYYFHLEVAICFGCCIYFWLWHELFVVLCLCLSSVTKPFDFDLCMTQISPFFAFIMWHYDLRIVLTYH